MRHNFDRLAVNVSVSEQLGTLMVAQDDFIRSPASLHANKTAIRAHVKIPCNVMRCDNQPEPTIRPNHGKSAFHVNAKVEVPEQLGPPRVPKVHIIEAQDGRGHWLSRRKLEDVIWVLLNELSLTEALNGLDPGLNQGGSFGIEPELVDEGLWHRHISLSERLNREADGFFVSVHGKS